MIIPFLAFCLVATCNAELRTWTAVNGKEVEAEFVSNSDGQVTLKLKSGKVFKVPLDKLSKGDQEFLKSKSPSKEPTDGEALLKFLPLISDYDVERFAKDAMHYDSTDTTDYTGWTKVVYEGQLVELVQWKNGQPDGFAMLWYTNGKIWNMSLNKEGKEIQVQEYYKTGEKKMLMRKGIASRVWHKNGKKAATMRGEPFTTSPSLKPLDPQSLEMKFWNDKGEEIDLEEGLKMLDEMMEEQYGDTIESEDEIGAETEAE